MQSGCGKLTTPSKRERFRLARGGTCRRRRDPSAGGATTLAPEPVPEAPRPQCRRHHDPSARGTTTLVPEAPGPLVENQTQGTRNETRCRLALAARQGSLARGEKPPSRAAWEPGFLDDVAFAVDTDRAFACRPWHSPRTWAGPTDLGGRQTKPSGGGRPFGRLDERRQARPAEPGVGRGGDQSPRR